MSPESSVGTQAPDPMAKIVEDFYPYRDRYPIHDRLEPTGRERAEILAELTAMAREEDALGDAGRCSGSIYHGDHEHYHFLTEAFEAFAHANVLQRDMYPSANKLEAEVVAMTLAMLNAGAVTVSTPCGVVTSGGSESLINALYTYREWAAAERGIRDPQVIMPVTGHVAMDKAAHYFGIELLHAPTLADTRVDVDWVREHVTERTIALVGSAGSYSYGAVDDIEALGELAVSHGIGLHVDGCLGGFLLPWIERLGRSVPPWDFRVPGVTSISADTHKYGYALKGTSVLAYRDTELRRHSYFTATSWPGGIYLSPGISGSRSGGLIAATWAAMVNLGEQGYLEAAQGIAETCQTIRAGIGGTDDGIEGLQLLGDSVFMASFGVSEPLQPSDIYLVNDVLLQRGWRLNALHLPPALRFCLTRPNSAQGVAEAFLADLAQAVEHARAHSGDQAGSGALYGMGGTPAGQEALGGMLSLGLDLMYALPPR